MAQGWLKAVDLVLGDGLDKILLMNRRPGLYACRAGQHQRRPEAEELIRVALRGGVKTALSPRDESFVLLQQA